MSQGVMFVSQWKTRYTARDDRFCNEVSIRKPLSTVYHVDAITGSYLTASLPFSSVSASESRSSKSSGSPITCLSSLLSL